MSDPYFAISRQWTISLSEQSQFSRNQHYSMSKIAHHPVLKMNGLGNEIVIMDLRGNSHRVTAEEARSIGRGEGLLFDQMMVLHDPRTHGSEAFVLIYNIDGTEAGACGNGTRCVAWYIAQKTGKSHFTVETRAGILECERLGPLMFAVDMGKPEFRWQQVPLSQIYNQTNKVTDDTNQVTDDTNHVRLDTAYLNANFPVTFSGVSMGNPHAIFFVENVEAHELVRTGPLLETHPIFPEKANISLASVTSPTTLTLKVWERGAGLTRACGSGACAAAVAAHRRGLTGRKVTVTLPGGDLLIDWRDDNHVMMTGAVELEFETTLAPALFQSQA
jgi:diaminopimelate epimerase